MSAFDELAIQCERRGWRLCLCGTYPQGKREPGLIINNLTVRSSIASGRELLATTVAGPQMESLEAASLDCAQSLSLQGLIG